MNQGFAPIRRGLLDHLRTMSSNATKLYLFLHLSARWTGNQRGTVETRYRAIGLTLGWPGRRIKRTMAELQPRYVEILQAGNQHRPTVIRILNYDGAGAIHDTGTYSVGATGGTYTRELVPKTATYPVKSGTSTSQIPNKHAASGAPKNVLEVKNKKKYPSSSEEESIQLAATTPFECWKAIGETLPLGTAAFQEIWKFLFEHKNGEPLSVAMERAIQRAQAKRIAVPRPFFAAKRRVEQSETSQGQSAADQIHKFNPQEIPA